MKTPKILELYKKCFDLVPERHQISDKNTRMSACLALKQILTDELGDPNFWPDSVLFDFYKIVGCVGANEDPLLLVVV